MNQKDKKQIGISWIFTIFGSILGFFISIISNSVFDMYANGYRFRVFILLIIFTIMSAFLIGFLSYIFDRSLEELRDKEKTFVYFLVNYIKSIFKKSE